MKENKNRRNFIKSLGTLGLGAAIVPSVSTLAQTPTDKETIDKKPIEKKLKQLLVSYKLPMFIVKFIRTMNYFGKMAKLYLVKQVATLT